MKGRIFEFFAFSFLGAVLMVSGDGFLKAEDGEKKGLTMDRVVSILASDGKDLLSNGISVIHAGDIINDYVNTHRQIISSVDGLGAAVDSLKANDASVFEFQHEKVYDYKVGSLSGGKDVYVKVFANAIGPGGYNLIVDAYLLDRNNPSDTIYLGGVGLRRWGMPHASTNTARPWKFADLAEDVQSFIKALRVYEFKDRWVAFFAAQEYLDEIDKYKHKFRIFVIPKAKKGEEGWFEPYYMAGDLPGMKRPLKEVYDVFAVYKGNLTGTILAVLEKEGDQFKEFYGVSFLVTPNRTYRTVQWTDGVNMSDDTKELFRTVLLN